MRPISVVVVDLPLVPVMATMRPASQRAASSSFADDRHAGGAGRGDVGLPRRDARAEDDQVGAVQRLGPMAAELEDDAGPAQLVGRIDRLAGVGQHDAGAARDQQVRRGHAAARRPDDDHALARHAEGGRRRHRSFRVARLVSANTIATMMKRA